MVAAVVQIVLALVLVYRRLAADNSRHADHDRGGGSMMGGGGGGGGGGQMQQVAQEIEQMEQEVEAIDEEIERLREKQTDIDEAIEAIETLDSGSTVQVPLGGDAYIRATIEDIDEVVVSLGGGYSAEREQDGAVSTLEASRSAGRPHQRPAEEKAESRSRAGDAGPTADAATADAADEQQQSRARRPPCSTD